MDIYQFLMTDFYFTDDGDFQLKGGDFFSTDGMEGQAVIQEIQDRIKSYPADWKILPEKGCLLPDYQGEPNNRDTHGEIEQAIKIALTHDRFLGDSDFQVLVAPLSRSKVGIRVDLSNPMSTTVNKNSKTMKVIYDLDGAGPYIGRI